MCHLCKIKHDAVSLLHLIGTKGYFRPPMLYNTRNMKLEKKTRKMLYMRNNEVID